MDYGNWNTKLEVPGALSPGANWLLSQTADQVRQRETLEQYRNAAQQGYTPDEVNQMKTAQEAIKVAEQTAHLSDEEFDRMSMQLANEMGKTPNAVTMPTLKDPNLGQMAAAAIGSLMFPKYAMDIGATPFQAQMQGRQEEFQRRQMDAQAEAARQEASIARQKILAGITEARASRNWRRVSELQKDLRDMQEIANKRISDAQSNDLKRQQIEAELEKARIASEDRKASTGLRNTIDLRKMAKDAVNVSEDERLWAAQQLREAGEAPYVGKTDEQLMAAIKDGSVAARERSSRIDLNEVRKRLAESGIPLNEARTAKLNAELEWLPKEKALSIAKGYAQIDNIRDLINYRGDLSKRGWTALDIDRMTQARLGAGALIDGYGYAIAEMSKRRTEIDNAIYAEEQKGDKANPETLAALKRDLDNLDVSIGKARASKDEALRDAKAIREQLLQVETGQTGRSINLGANAGLGAGGTKPVVPLPNPGKPDPAMTGPIGKKPPKPFAGAKPTMRTGQSVTIDGIKITRIK